MQPGTTRRQVFALLAGAAVKLRAADANAPMRLALSESLVSGVNINDARVAMQVWIQQMTRDLQIPVEVSPRVFESSEEIARRARGGLEDVVGLTAVEYRQIAEYLDPGLILAEGGSSATVQYLLLVKKSSGATRLSDLRGHRLAMVENTRMCIASAWLATLLAEAHLGAAEQFFGSITPEMKASHAILPVFFGQTDACLTSKSTVTTMCEMNPQVGKDLTALAASPPVVTALCAFHKDYHGVGREKLSRIYIDAPTTAAAEQLATLFEFRRLMPKDANYLKPTLAILDAAERISRERTPGGLK